MENKVLLLIIIILLTSCSNYHETQIGSVSKVSGDAALYRHGNKKAIQPGMIINADDSIVTSNRSMLNLKLNDSTGVFIKGNTKLLLLNPAQSDQNVLQNNISLVQGSVWLKLQKKDTVRYCIVTANGSIVVDSGDIVIAANQEKKESEVFLFNSSALLSAGSKTVPLTSCKHSTFSSGISSVTELISQRMIIELKEWYGSAIDSLISQSGCMVQVPVRQKLHPVWNKLPREACAANIPFIDTVNATDPENSRLEYGVIDAPMGFKIDSRTGIIRFLPSKGGQFPIRLRVMDADSMTSDLEYNLSVTEGLGVDVSVPNTILLSVPVSIRAHAFIGGKKINDKCSFRFDFDGNGASDYPKTGEFGNSSIVTYTYTKEGIYNLKAEVKANDGSRAIFTKQIIVKTAPVAHIVVKPAIGMIGSEFVLDASGSGDKNDPADSMLVRFDTDGDGEWDLPQGGGFIREKRVIWTWQQPGKYKVRCQVMNPRGISDTAETVVALTNGITIESIVMSDTIHINDPVKIECSLSNQEYKINKYEWSLDNDTVFEILADNPGVSHTFTKEGTFNVICRITDEMGQVGNKSKAIVVINAITIIEAGGPYDAFINKPVKITGKVKDVDNKVVEFGWDFDGDGKADSVSKDKPDVSYTFTKSGPAMIIFSAKTDDGVVWKDSAKVNVSNKKPVADAGADIVSKAGKKVKLYGTGTDEDQNVSKYEWDFNNDGTYDWSSPDTGHTTHVFESYTKAVLRVTDSDGESSTDTLKVIVCPEDMEILEKGKFCIDKYEFPNKKGQIPELNVTYNEAQERCKAEGKRLCTADEWQAACRNEEKNRDYPYGKHFETDRCNNLGNAFIKNKIAVSGEFPNCSGAAGIIDMSGNAAEWVENGNVNPYAYGGSWQNGKNESKCDSKVQLQKGKKYFYVGFRCCK